jgi:acetylornithine aminotransferase/acetylornithine/N-succinyldiaminopimelate aminotransferase
VTLPRGHGDEVFDDQGQRYLDFLGGISVNSLGHTPKVISEALHAQVDQLWHVSNLYHIPPQIELAQILIDNSCFDQAFFCNSGTEAVEAALKLSRIASTNEGRGDRHVTVAMNRSFHGRTYGSLSVTGQAAYQAPFQPLVPEVRFADFGSLESLDSQLDDSVADVILEPLQAEGGLNSPPKGYLQGVRDLCDQHGAFLIFDEVQVGMGRLGHLFAHEKYGVEPDIISLATALGSGVPIGAMLAKGQLSQHFVPGTHASTFGGNPLAASAGLATVRELLSPGFFESVQERSQKLIQHLDIMVQKHDHIISRKGEGRLLGWEFTQPGGPLVKSCLEAGLLVGSAGPNVLRLAPALNLAIEHLEEGMVLLNPCLENTSL